MSVLPRIEEEYYEGFYRLGLKEKDTELLEIARKIGMLNTELKYLEDALKTCDSREIVYHYGRVMSSIDDLKEALTKRALAFKPLPERVIPLVELEDMEKEITRLVTEGIKTCTIKGLVK